MNNNTNNITFVNYVVNVNKKPFLAITGPKGDGTAWGTMSGIKKNEFRFDKVKFLGGDVFLDLGCNIGVISCFVAKMFPQVNVIGIDASPVAIRLAKINATNNKLINTYFFNVAVGTEDKKNVSFYSNSKEITCLIDEKFKRGYIDEYHCNLVSLATIIETAILGIDKIKYLKVDIEGNEFELFDYLFDQRPDLLDKIEYIHLEVHNYKELAPEKLRIRVKEKFGEKCLAF